MTRWIPKTLVCVGLSLVLACSQRPAPNSDTPDDLPRGKDYLLSTEPDQARGVIETREHSADQESVVVVGRIGGSVNPWVEGRAAFAIVDLSLEACSDKEGDSCETPWDYCCETDRLAQATLLVKVMDDSGKLLPVDARQMLGVAELQTVVVQGTAQRDDAGNVTVLASGLFLRP